MLYHLLLKNEARALPFTIKKNHCKTRDSFVTNEGALLLIKKSKFSAKARLNALRNAAGDESIDESISWVPPTTALMEALEDSLAQLAGLHEIKSSKFAIDDRVIPSLMVAVSETRGIVRGAVVAVHLKDEGTFYDVLWELLPVVNRQRHSGLDDEPDEEDEIVEYNIPARRLKASTR